MKFVILALFIPLLIVVVHSKSTLSLEKLIRKMLGSSNQHKDQDSKEKEIFIKGSLSFLEFYFNRLNISSLTFFPGTKSTSKIAWKSFKSCGVRARFAKNPIFGNVCVSQMNEAEGSLIITGYIRGLSPGKIIGYFFFIFRNILILIPIFIKKYLRNQNCTITIWTR